MASIKKLCSKFKIGVQVSSEAFSYTDLINWVAPTRMMFLSEMLGMVCVLDSQEGPYFAQAPSKPVSNMCSVGIRILVKSKDFSQLKPLTPHLTSFLVPAVERDMGVQRSGQELKLDMRSLGF